MKSSATVRNRLRAGAVGISLLAPLTLGQQAAHAVSSPGYPVFSAAVRTATGDQGIWSTIKAIDNTSGTSSSNTKYVANWIGASETSGTGTSWVRTGWLKGDCGGTYASRPTAYVWYRSGSTSVCTLYSSYFLSAGANYEFRLRHISGTTWRALLLHGGTWNTLQDRNTGFGPSSNYSQQAAEYFAPINTSLPTIDGDVTFLDTQLDVGSVWSAWNSTKATFPAQASELSGLRYMAFDNYYSDWRVTPDDPVLTQTLSQTTAAILPGTTKDIGVTVGTNKAFDSKLLGNAQFTVNVPSSATGLSATMHPTDIAIRANSSGNATLRIQALLPLASPATITLTVCGGGDCDSDTVTVTTT